jgi:hypothetical protein
MSWLFSQALVEEYWGENFLDGAQSAPLNGSRTQQAFCAPDKMTDFSRLFQFGMTYKPLTENRGEELLTLYLAGFHAKTLALQEKAQELMEKKVECGEKWRGSFVKYDPDSSLWKTHQCSLLGDLDEFSETWPQWGLMHDGECWEQRTLEQTIRGTGYGLSLKVPPPPPTLPTPVKSDYKGTSKNSKFQSRKIQYKAWDDGTGASTLYPNPLAYEALMGWPEQWTDLKPLEMDKSHCAPQPLGES